MLKRFMAPDKIAFEKISKSRKLLKKHLPSERNYLFIQTNGVIPARLLLFVGTKALHEFEYDDIRGFAKRALEVCASECPDAQKIALTIHGVGFGLDETEALYAQVVGLNEAISARLYPPSLRSIAILERDKGRVSRLRLALNKMAGPAGDGPLLVDEPAAMCPDMRPLDDRIVFEGARRSPTEIRRPGSKPSIFVAMPFAGDMDDTFFYGIQKPIEEIGFLCERADLAAFTGDVMTWVREKISSAIILVAELTGSNPNVYLEVGFAWGIGKPSVLLIKKADELKFDLRGQRCLVYSNIRDLERKLEKELRSLLQNDVDH